MTMVIEHQHRQYGGIGYDSVYQNHVHPSPQFNEPAWSAQNSSHPPSVYPSSMASSTVPMSHQPKREEIPRPPMSMPYSSIPVSAPSMGTTNSYNTPAYGGSEMLVLQPEIPRTTFEQHQSYPAASPMNNSFTPANYTPLDYAQSLHHQQQQGQPPHPHAHPAQHPDSRNVAPGSEPSPPQPIPTQSQAPAAYGDALDASRGMVALSQDMTPRNIYAPRASRGSAESYGFPSAPSSASSISSAGTYPYYSASAVSVDSSVTDYSSNSDTFDGVTSRTLPRPTGLIATPMPPGPQSMMGQFNSKVPTNAQKKHKCKVCDKRFTRPSSLQTHMYSHTGEKPYACDVEGCGRHFSVVSNLRRHKKVHKGEKDSGSPEDDE